MRLNNAEYKYDVTFNVFQTLFSSVINRTN